MKTLKNSSYLVLIAVLTVVMCLTMAFGTTAFADGDEARQTDATEAAVIQQEAEAPAAQAPDPAQESSTADDQKTSGSEIKDSVNAVNNAGSGALSETTEQTVSVSEDPQDANARQTEQGSDRSQATDAARENSAAPEQNDAEAPENDQGSPEGEGTEVKDENTSVESVNADAEETEDDEAEKDGTALEEDAGTREPDEGNGEDAVNGDSPETEDGTGAEPNENNSNITDGGEQATAVEKIGEVDLTEAAEEATEGAVNGTIGSNFDYSITFTSCDKSTEVTGGQENSLSAILAGLGYEITPETLIEVDQESVDTDVINVTETVNGYVLTDNGVFGKASKNLVVYVNGQRVEIEVVDPAYIGTNQTADSLASAFSADPDGNIKLTNNITVSDSTDGTVKTVTLSSGEHDLYLNGFTLTGATTGPLFTINSGATLNVYGGESASDTTKSGNINGADIALFNVQTGGTLNIISGNVKASGSGGASSNPYAAVVVNGTANISGGSVEASANSASAIKITNSKGEVNVSGGSISGKGTKVAYNGYGIYATYGTVTVSGGSISGTAVDQGYGSGIYAKNATVKVSNGSISGKNESFYGHGIHVQKSTVTVSGGSISGTGKVGHGIRSASSEVTVSGGSITGTGTSENGNGIYVESSCTVTVSGGTIIGTSNTNTGHGIAANGKWCTVTVSGGTITGTSTTGTGYGIEITEEAANNETVVTVKGGLISGTTEALYDVSEDKVTGGYFSSDNCISGKASLINEDVGVTVNGKTYKYKVGSMAATVNGTPYSTIADAVTVASASGKPIVLTGDVIENITIAENQNIILDLNGYGLYATDNSSAVMVENNGTFTLQDSSEAKNGTVKAYGTTTDYTNPYAAIAVTGGKAEISGGTVTATGTQTNNKIIEYVSAIKLTDNGTVNVSSGSISSTSKIRYAYGIYADSSIVTVSGGSISSNGSNLQTYAYGICANSSTVTVSGGSIGGNSKGTGNGITAKKSTVTVSGGSISGTGNSNFGRGISATLDCKVIVSGGKITGISASSAGDGIYAYRSTVTVSGGTITGISASDVGYGIHATDSGTVTVSGGSFSGTSTSSIGYGIYAWNGSTVTVNGGSVTGNVMSSRRVSATTSGAVVTISGGKFNGTLSAENDGTLTIFGGTFSLEPDTTFIAEHCSKSESGNLWTVAPDTGYAVSAVSKTGAIAAAYKTIAEAITALDTNTDGVIYLLKNVKENVTIPESTTVTIDLNGKILSAKDNTKTVVDNKGTLTLTDSGATGGNITGGAKGVEQNGTMTLAGKVIISGNINGTTLCNLYLSKDKTVTVADGFTGTVGVTTKDEPASGIPVAITGSLTKDFSKFFTADNGDYYISDVVESENHTIKLFAKTHLTVSSTTVNNKTYDGTTQATVSPENVGTLIGIVSGDKVSIDSVTATFADKKAGTGRTVTVSYTLKGDDAYKYCVDDTLTEADIAAKQLTVTGTKADGKTYDGNDTANAHVGTVGVGDIVDGDDVTVEVNTATFADTNAGNNKTVTVSYKLTGNDAGNYAAPADDTTLADIEKRSVTMTSDTASKTYDGKALEAKNVTVTGDGFIEGEGATYSSFASITDAGTSKNTFTYQLNNATSADNYSITQTEGDLTVEQKQLTVTGTTADGKTYDGTDTANAHVGTVGGKEDGDDVTVEVDTATFADKNAGNDKDVTVSYKLTGDDAGNYTAPETETTSADIEKRSVTMTSDTASKTYDGKALEAKNVTVTGDGFIEGEGATYSSFASITDAGTSKNTFTYRLNNDTSADNYSITQAEGDLTVNMADNNTVTDLALNDWTYGDNANTPTATATFGDITYSYKLKDAAETAYATTVPTNAGTYIVKASVAETDNYNGASATKEFTIAQKQLTIDEPASVEIKEYDGTTDATVEAKGSIIGTITGDTVEFAVSAAFADKNAGTGKTINLTYTLSGPDAYNYKAPVDVTLSNGEITQREVYVEGTTADSKVYDGTTAAVSHEGTLTGVIFGDDVGFVVVSATFADMNAGNSKAVTVTYTLSGADAGNYTVSGSTTSADIEKRSVTMTSDDAEKTYDGTALEEKTVTESGDGFIEGEGADYSDFNSLKNAGSDDNSFSYSLRAGTIAENYDIEKVYGTLTVLPKELTVEGTTVMDKTYDGSVKATVKELGELTGMIPADDVEIDEPTAEFEDASVGIKKKVYVTYTLKGELAGNYTVAVSETEATINPVPQPAEEPAVRPYVKPVTLETLNTAQQAAVKTVTADGTQELVNVVEVSLNDTTANAENGRYTFTIKAELLKGTDSSKVRVWFVNEDGTLTEVEFTVDEYGNIVILNGRLDIYFVTVDNTVVETVEKA